MLLGKGIPAATCEHYGITLPAVCEMLYAVYAMHLSEWRIMSAEFQLLPIKAGSIALRCFYCFLRRQRTHMFKIKKKNLVRKTVSIFPFLFHAPDCCIDAEGLWYGLFLVCFTLVYWNTFRKELVHKWPPLWSSGQSSWLQIRRPGFDSRHYQRKKVVGLEQGPLSLVSTTEELLDRKVAAPV
jgi:hypothetical protein